MPTYITPYTSATNIQIFSRLVYKNESFAAHVNSEHTKKKNAANEFKGMPQCDTYTFTGKHGSKSRTHKLNPGERQSSSEKNVFRFIL